MQHILKLSRSKKLLNNIKMSTFARYLVLAEAICAAFVGA
jgi:hypothetical protein